jgi:2-polyprenyl-3-methyl-5-hydroxy-6-metoxy-1,4-benzoquinol methylase
MARESAERSGGDARRTTTAAACPICGSPDTRRYCRKGESEYHTCTECGVLFQHPLPGAGAMHGYADAEYDAGLYRDYVEARDMKLAHFERRLGLIASRVGKGRLLDVGCSCGYFMEVAARHGYDVQGLEFSRNAIAAASPAVRPRILHATIDTLHGGHDRVYDVITAFDIIEHLARPLAFLEDAHRLLSPGGHLVVSTPDAGHWLRPLAGSRWPMLQPMQHLTLFSRRALLGILEQAGFVDVHVDTAYKVISWEYLIGQIRTLNPWAHAVLRRAARLVSAAALTKYRPLNIGEILAVARKPSQ